MNFPFDKISLTSNDTYSFVRFLNATPNADALTIAVNGVNMHDKVNYKDFTGYDKAETGTYNITAFECGKPCLSTDIAFSGQKIYTVAIVGSSDKMGVCTIYDPADSVHASGQKNDTNSYVRICGLSNSLPLTDIYFNGIKVISGLSCGDVSQYITVAPNNYNVSVKIHESGYELLKPVSMCFEKGRHHSVHIVGTQEDLSIV